MTNALPDFDAWVPDHNELREYLLNMPAQAVYELGYGLGPHGMRKNSMVEKILADTQARKDAVYSCQVEHAMKRYLTPVNDQP